MTEPRGALHSILGRDRAIVAFALVTITLLAWAYLWFLSRDMRAMSGASMPAMPGMTMPVSAPDAVAWTAQHAFLQFAMWAVMMVGMMTPSVAPTVLLYERVAEQASARQMAFAPPIWFALGYLLAWSAFAALATAAQWLLERYALLTPMLASASPYLAGGVLILAGIYQWTPLKDSCLAQCRAPLSFIQSHGGFRPGISASLTLGLRHGLACVGCCWSLMALLFVAGVMNLVWIAALMVFVLAEKVVPGGRILTRVAGVGAVAAGALSLAVH